MRQSFFGLLVLGFVALNGCNRSSPEGAAATASSPSAKPEATVAMKPVVGEAENTFSLSVPHQPTSLKQGTETGVLIGINRGKNFDEEVGLKVDGLPDGVTVVSADPVIKHGSKDVSLMLKAADDAALGDFTVKVTGHRSSSGADSSHEFQLSVVQK